MKKNLPDFSRHLLFPALFLLTGFGWNGCSRKIEPVPEDDTLDFVYQYSVISALQAGVFDGNLPFGRLKTKGDFGLGTFNRLDGELVIDQGNRYRVRFDGTVKDVSDLDTTSFVVVKFFKPDTTFTVNTPATRLDSLQKQIAGALPANQLYAIRIKGRFPTVTARAPAPAAKPFPTLTEHLMRNQYLFNLTNTSGVAVGFLVPKYMEKTNPPGFHFHYLSDDRKTGGHVLDLTAGSVVVEIDRAQGYIVEANTHAGYNRVKLESGNDSLPVSF
ncbi:acetolactate decarboxylase [Larkinella soli]|uniref:acetolactate decarboxylase n=1 Tax=Larkinella soli TaxID=1770527 RepID=UPI000FFBB639|nr:acetolactate decarboxylase [Larkinella soli]